MHSCHHTRLNARPQPGTSPNIPNPGQEDTDGDGIADACESQTPIAVGGIVGLLDSSGDEQPPRSPQPASGSVPFGRIIAVATLVLSLAILGRISRSSPT